MKIRTLDVAWRNAQVLGGVCGYEAAGSRSGDPNVIKLKSGTVVTPGEGSPCAAGTRPVIPALSRNGLTTHQ